MYRSRSTSSSVKRRYPEAVRDGAISFSDSKKRIFDTVTSGNCCCRFSKTTPMDMVFFFGVFGTGLTAAACCFAALTMLLFSPERFYSSRLACPAPAHCECTELAAGKPQSCYLLINSLSQKETVLFKN